MSRIDQRKADELRQVNITKDFIIHPEGSILIEMGKTKVICNATVEDRVPPFKKGSGEGWITAEYAMLPRATNTRNQRDINKLKMNKRSVEIQRLIGRAIRSVVDFKALGERSILLDCDVIQADGGTRTASITGGFMAVYMACQKLLEEGVITEMPMKGMVAAISVGVVGDEPLLDLCYEEDSHAKVDMNVIMTDKGQFIEVQGTGEEAPFTRKELDQLLALGEKGTKELIEMQKQVLGLGKKKVIFATKNKKKLKEINAILEGTDLEVVSMEDAGIDIDVVEDGTTFEENALKKAVEIMEASGEIVLADDSGLEVDYMDKEPGIHSARFAGRDTSYKIKNQMILDKLEGVAKEDRTARFACAIAVAFPDGTTNVVRENFEGIIADKSSGDNGFGYDPIFFVEEYGMTSAEMEPKLKNEVSHRGKALRKMKDVLVEMLQNK